MEYAAIIEEFPSGLVDVLVTIRPQHAARIYAGDKTFELRKTAPRITPRRMFLYETEKVRAITGHLVIEKVLRGEPEKLWKHTGEAATTRARFRDYFSESVTAVAFKIAKVVKYRKPVHIDEIKEIDSGFRLPQNFLYLDNFPAVSRALSRRALEETTSQATGQIKLLPVRHQQAASFRRMVKSHIDGAYLETGLAYADKLLEINSRGSDVEGIFTLRKHIFAVRFRSRAIGFVVLTEKQGGCIKTGPVMIMKSYRDRGVGTKLRHVLAQSLSQAGYRKIYCTVPANNKAAIAYLLNSGYRIEAHLERPYHNDHNEIVFGYHLGRRVYSPREYFRQIEVATTFERVTKPGADIAPFISETFPDGYADVDWRWVTRQIDLSGSIDLKKDFKPRAVYAARGLHLLAVALCTFKRGGGVKVLVLTQTAHQRSLTAFVQHIEEDLMRRLPGRFRKFYTHVPVSDLDTFGAMRTAGYMVEGMLQEPYRAGVDMIALGKMV